MSDTPVLLSNRSILLLAFASAIVTANAYYIHPIIGPVADSFAVGDGLVGIVPAANQIALALGVVLLLPLGDRQSNRRLVMLFLPAQVLALIAMTMLSGFAGFVIASTVLGFFTITPYLLPAYTSKRVDPARLGSVTATLTVGVVAGVQLARIGSGVIAEVLGWRAVYGIAAALMVIASIALPMMMDDKVESREPRESYTRLLRSLFHLSRSHSDVVWSGIIQGLNFGVFIAVWMGIGLHLTSDALNLGTDVVGYLSAFSLLSLLTTPRLGKWADQQGAERARFKMGLVNLAGVACYGFAAIDWWWLLIPIVVTSLAGPMVDVSGRMVGLRKDPAIRTRLMTVYITLMFVGGSLGSWSGTYAYDIGGWWGTVAWGVTLSLLAVVMSYKSLTDR